MEQKKAYKLKFVKNQLQKNFKNTKIYRRKPRKKLPSSFQPENTTRFELYPIIIYKFLDPVAFYRTWGDVFFVDKTSVVEAEGTYVGFTQVLSYFKKIITIKESRNFLMASFEDYDVVETSVKLLIHRLRTLGDMVTYHVANKIEALEEMFKKMSLVPEEIKESNKMEEEKSLSETNQTLNTSGQTDEALTIEDEEKMKTSSEQIDKEQSFGFETPGRDQTDSQQIKMEEETEALSNSDSQEDKITQNEENSQKKDQREMAKQSFEKKEKNETGLLEINKIFNEHQKEPLLSFHFRVNKGITRMTNLGMNKILKQLTYRDNIRIFEECIMVIPAHEYWNYQNSFLDGFFTKREGLEKMYMYTVEGVKVVWSKQYSFWIENENIVVITFPKNEQSIEVQNLFDVAYEEEMQFKEMDEKKQCLKKKDKDWEKLLKLYFQPMMKQEYKRGEDYRCGYKIIKTEENGYF